MDGSKRHVFTEPLPRQRTATGDCAECERRPYGRDEAPPSVRGFTYTAGEVADALIAIGRGSTYSSAACAARVRAGRALPPLHPAARPRASRDSAIVEDWRTNLMLGLMQAHLNNLDDVHAYTREIRQAALALGGWSAPRGRITDRRGYSSLWS